MKKLLLIIIGIFCCSLSFAQQYVIKATITGFKDSAKFILTDLDADAPVDSALLINNKLTLTGKFFDDIPKGKWLSTTYNGKFYYVNLFMANDKINVTGDIKDFPFFLNVSGPTEQNLYTQLNKQTAANYQKRNELVAKYFEIKEDTAQAKHIWKVIHKLDASTDSIKRSFINTHLNSYTALTELYYLNDSYNRDTLQLMYKRLLPAYKNSIYGQRFQNYLLVGTPLKTGDTYTDFEGIDKTGKNHKLSDVKGKYVLLDFSTTYCGPCMSSVSDMKKLSEKYGDKLAIITFSCDANKNIWLAGVNRDNPSWLSLWDGKGGYGKTVLKYGVTGYPSFFLVNPEGKIVSTKVGYDEGSLEKTIAPLLAK
ncbi:Cytochrome oxidase Cu insertion factor, SCO1/SenC/PrrC family [Mucilaginibacter pineti]|uniref:Cytochrome oxidase Cu insertion factor, SCO1/SenC/PrrC family n=1 Tax=Mucilaginibacter pineti TaxID=1391627 RepID=A0A1G7K5J8_9SPHI|nr:TlpA disulfide reductase family protein [Mucilaginibacter pineti]SDF32618.1 Cytochrome oxidase Cu insertion factor, SCO1/SenC/PrrC family [Mucilaginibacter pineti]